MLSFAACSSNDDKPAPPPEDRDGPSAGLPDGPSAALPDGPPVEGGAGRPGLIVLAWNGDSVGGSAGFAGAATTTAPPPCTTVTVGPCTVTTCPSPSDVPDGVEASAGTLTFSGGSKPIVMKPSSVLSGGYTVTDGIDAMLVAEQTVSVAAEGGDVPAFSAIQAKVPAGIDFEGDLSQIDTTQDLKLTWTGGSASGKVVAQFASDDQTKLKRASCAFDALARQGTVPVGIWPHLTPCPADGDTVCTFQVLPQVATHFTAGDWSVDFMVVATGAVGLYQTSGAQ